MPDYESIAARRGNAQLCVGHNRRFQQHVKLAKQLLAKGLIGEMVGVQAEEGSSRDWAALAYILSIPSFPEAERCWTWEFTRLT